MARAAKFRNAVRIEGEVAYITIGKKKPFEVMVDTDQLTKIIAFGYSLSAHPRGYAFFGIFNGDNVSLHRFLTGAPEGQQVDHINRDTKDNRLSNLRIVTARENMNNRSVESNVKERNICWSPAESKFRVKVTNKGKQYLKRFNTIEEAIEYRDKLLAELA